jgi:hypothetical protein
MHVFCAAPHFINTLPLIIDFVDAPSTKLAYYDSAFHLSYNMLLNQMRSEESNPEELLRQSFHQFQCDRALPKLQVIFFPFLCVLLFFSSS